LRHFCCHIDGMLGNGAIVTRNSLLIVRSMGTTIENHSWEGIKMASSTETDGFVRELKDIFSFGTVFTGLLGVIFILISRSPELHTGFQHLSRDIGFALIIAVVVGVVIERRHRKRWAADMVDRSQTIAENVFSGVFQADLPPKLVSETISLGLKVKIIREDFDVTYCLTSAPMEQTSGIA
jgi:hypothetical protein